MNKELAYKFVSIQSVSKEYKPELHELKIAINDESTDFDIIDLFDHISDSEINTVKIDDINLSNIIIRNSRFR